MTGLKRILTLLTLALALLSSCKRMTERKDVVIVSPYEPYTQIFNNFINSAKEQFSDTSRYRLHFYYVHTYPSEFFHLREYERDLSPMFKKVLRLVERDVPDPDLIILHGDYLAHAAARMDDPLLRRCPLLSTAVIDPEWKNLLAMMPNMVVMEARPAVKENLDFIQEMGFPNQVLTIMDSTYIDDRIRRSILEQIGDDENYRPNLHLEQEDRIRKGDSRDPRTTLYPFSMMWPEKNDRHPGMPGAFDANWIFYTQQQEMTYLHIKDDAYSSLAMSRNIGYFFTMTPEYFDLSLVSALNSCLGGYFTPFPSMWKQVHPIVDKLLSGTDPKNIPWGTLEKDYWLDWRLARNLRPYASDFPKGVRFVHLPWRERSRFLTFLADSSVVLILILFFIIALVIPGRMFILQARQRKQLLEKAGEAEKSRQQVEFVLSQINSYIWRMLPDLTLKFSPSFYKDFAITENCVIDVETVLSYIEEPGRSNLRDILARDVIEGDKNLEVMIHVPGTSAPRPVLVHIISIDNPSAGGNHSSYRLKSGLFYFNDEAHQRNEELRKAYRRSEEISEKEYFLASMDNTVRNPLDRIEFFSRLLSDHYGTLSEEQRARCGEEVMSGNDVLMGILDRMMGARAGISEPVEEQVPVSELNVADVMSDVYISQSGDAKKNSRLNFVPGPDDCIIRTSRPVLIQVMNRLITNAMNVHKGTVTIGWVENAGQEVVIFIDNSDRFIYRSGKLLGAVGGTIKIVEYPDAPVRIEITFAAPPYRGNDLSGLI